MVICNSPDTAWYLLQCKPRQDARAVVNLQNQNYRLFCPQITRMRTVGSAQTAQSEPLFPGYLFINLAAEDNWAALRSTRGVSRLVSFDNKPAQVSNAIIAGLQARCRRPVAPKLPTPGDSVRITQGPLEMLEGIFLAMDGQQRVVILMQLLSRQQQVHLPLQHIEVLAPAQTA